jgi:hypothetical protein
MLSPDRLGIPRTPRGSRRQESALGRAHFGTMLCQKVCFLTARAKPARLLHRITLSDLGVSHGFQGGPGQPGSASSLATCQGGIHTEVTSPGHVPDSGGLYDPGVNSRKFGPDSSKALADSESDQGPFKPLRERLPVRGFQSAASMAHAAHEKRLCEPPSTGFMEDFTHVTH